MNEPQPHAGPPADGIDDRSRARAFAVILAAGFMTLLDVSIVNVALPSIQASLRADASHLQWMVAGYSLAFGLILVPAGRFGDVFGRRRMFLWGVGLFAAASAACGLVTSADALVAARLVQGLGAAIINPQVIGFIQQLYAGPKRARAFGFFGASIGVSTAIGPLLGGILILVFGAHDGWRAVFLVNLPVSLVLLPLAARYLPREPQRARQQLNLDTVGLAVLGATVLAAMWPFVSSEGGSLTDAPWRVLGLAFLGAVVLFFWERHLDQTGQPAALPRSLMQNQGFVFGAAIGTSFFAGFSGLFLVVTLYLQQGLHWKAWQAGALQLPFAVMGAYSAARSGRWVTRWGRWCVVGALGFMAVGLVGVDLAAELAGDGVAPWIMMVFLAIGGFGNGAVISPNQALTLADVPITFSGTAGGVLQTLQRIGSAVGLAVVTSVYFVSLPLGHDKALSHALRVSVIMVGLSIVTAVTDALRRRQPRGARMS
jgi:MFS family permease